MKILLVSPIPPPAGGIATWTEKYRKYCDEHKIPLTIVNISLTGQRGKKINRKRNYIDEIKRTLRIWQDLSTQLKEENPDIIHINSACSKLGIIRDAFCISMVKRTGKPIVLHCRCNVQDQICSNIGKRVFRYMVRNSTRVLTLNKMSYAYCVELGGEKVISVPNFIEKEYLNDSYEVRSEVKRLVFVGHVQRTKGIYEILAAAEQLPDLEFIIIGPVQPEVREVFHPDNVRFLNALPNHEVKEQLKQADVFLFPSYTEGFSNALAEAMASGLPIITTDVGANREMIEDKGGIIIPVGSHEAIVEALTNMKEHSVRREMSSWNREKVRRVYLLDDVMRQLLSIYEKALIH